MLCRGIVDGVKRLAQPGGLSVREEELARRELGVRSAIRRRAPIFSELRIADWKRSGGSAAERLEDIPHWENCAVRRNGFSAAPSSPVSAVTDPVFVAVG